MSRLPRTFCQGILLALTIFHRVNCIPLEVFHNSETWPPVSPQKCSQSTKQKSMHSKMIFTPSLSSKPMTSMEVDVEWNELSFHPSDNPQKNGGVYVAYTTGVKKGPGGYLGVQIKATGGQFIFSFWDHGRLVGSGDSKKPVKASKLAWPVELRHCQRNCQDCAVKHLRSLKEKGLTTGTKCTVNYPAMKVGDRYKVILQRAIKQVTIATRDYGGMPRAHVEELGETDRKVTGGLWIVLVNDPNRLRTIPVGKIVLEGDGSGMNRLGTFDEMLGCNKCNAIQHKDTRYGPVVGADDRSFRIPEQVYGVSKSDKGKCKGYSISGSKRDLSVSFEGGPLTEDIFSHNKYHRIW